MGLLYKEINKMSNKNRTIIKRPVSGKETDVIVYIVHSLGGGVDGRDPNDKIRPVYATFDRLDAQANTTSWDNDKPEKRVIVLEDEVRNALDKLNHVEQLALKKYMEQLFLTSQR